MDKKPKVMIMSVIIGGLLLIGVWIFLLSSLLSKDNGTTDIQQDIQQDTGTQLPDNKLPTGSVLSGNNNNQSGNLVDTPEDTPVTQPQAFTSISLLIPPMIDTTSMTAIINQIEKQYQIPTQRVQFDTMESYRQALQIQLVKQQGIDIAFVPTIWTESFVDWGYYLPFKQPISGIFDQRFQSLVDGEAYTYIPTFIDPAISMIHTDYLSTYEQVGLNTLNMILSRPRQTDSFYIPLLFGFDSPLITTLAEGKTRFYNHQIVITFLLTLAAQLDQPGYLSFFMETPYRQSGLVDIAQQQLQDGEPSCREFGLLCMVAYEFSDVYLGLLSDYRLLNNHFADLSPDKHVSIHNFPAPEDATPIVGRGLIINKHSPDLASSLQRMKGYLNLLLEKKLMPWNPQLLSADNETYQRQILSTQYTGLKPYITNGQLIIGDLNDIKNIVDTTPLIKMLQGEYDISIYINSLELN